MSAINGNPDSLLTHMDRIPPYLCRFLAHKNHGYKPKSHLDIANEIGVAKSTVANISLRKTWEGIPVGLASKFAAACGVDLINQGRTKTKVAKTVLAHVNRAKGRQKQFLIRLMNQERGQEKSSASSSTALGRRDADSNSAPHSM